MAKSPPPYEPPPGSDPDGLPPPPDRKRIREAAGHTQAEVAVYVGSLLAPPRVLRDATVSGWENGRGPRKTGELRRAYLSYLKDPAGLQPK